MDCVGIASMQGQGEFNKAVFLELGSACIRFLNRIRDTMTPGKHLERSVNRRQDDAVGNSFLNGRNG